MNQSLPRSLPEAQGMPAEAIISFVKEIENRSLELHSFMVVRHGHVVAEGSWAPYSLERPHMLFSLSKSFTSTAIGWLVDEGRISLNDRVVSFFPEAVPAEVSQYVSDMTIHDLLIMGTGHAEDPSRETRDSENWVQAFLHAPVEYEPGTHFVYNSVATYMLSAILQEITGTTLLEYLQTRLMEPLGIQGATWESCPRGINVGGWGLMITTEDIAKFGQLYLQKGKWREEQILPESWVNRATSKQIANGSNPNSDWTQGYGYQFWRCRHAAYRGDGAFGQFCIVMPEQDTVIAITAGLSDMQAVLDVIWEQLLPVMNTEGLPLNPEASEALSEVLSRLSLHPPRLHATSTLETDIAGIQYELEDNEYQLRAISLAFTEDIVHLTYRDDKGEHTVHLGRQEWCEGRCSLYSKHEELVYGSATWQDAATLVVTIRYVETPFYLTLELAFTQGALTLHVRRNVSFDSVEPKAIAGKA
ncbi:serine hydrolase [Paenibacillus sp. SYP-B3998]|uniref:Serine hydrolase n=2 Tax=Paenibacillus sp. SYP-B3998 TaxID=2678564 RepID=A0A6G3ZRZ6_9BACL|nr:serine hydrolase [Paenibacillus sp. SYP-B3998]